MSILKDSDVVLNVCTHHRDGEIMEGIGMYQSTSVYIRRINISEHFIIKQGKTYPFLENKLIGLTIDQTGQYISGGTFVCIIDDEIHVYYALHFEVYEMSPEYITYLTTRREHFVKHGPLSVYPVYDRPKYGQLLGYVSDVSYAI